MNKSNKQNPVIRPTNILPACALKASSVTELQTMKNNETAQKRLNHQLTTLQKQNSRELYDSSLKFKQVAKDIRLVKLKASKSIEEWMTTSEKRMEMEKAEEKRKIGDRIERLRRRSSALGISSDNAKKIASIPQNFELSFEVANRRRRFSIDSVGSNASSESPRGSTDKLPILLPHVGLVANIAAASSSKEKQFHKSKTHRGRSNSLISQTFPPRRLNKTFDENSRQPRDEVTSEFAHSNDDGDDGDGNGSRIRCNTWPSQDDAFASKTSTVTRLPNISQMKGNLTTRVDKTSEMFRESENHLKTPNYYMCNYRNRMVGIQQTTDDADEEV